MNFVEELTRLVDSGDLDSARLLLLIDSFAGSDGAGSIGGLTKLAKLDFLLRYPVMLERALTAKKRSTHRVQVLDHERSSVESEMVRYRFGPWDHRYRALLNTLVAKGLVSVRVDGRKVTIGSTEKGRALAQQLSQDELFEPYVRRSDILKKNFDVTATNLMRFIYDTFPEVVSLRSNKPIPT